MHFRPLSFGLALMLVVTGCMAGTPTEQPTAATPTSTETVPVTPKPLPDQPENLTSENVVQFAKAYERAYTWNQEFTSDTIKMNVNPARAELLNTTDAGYIVHLEVGFSHTFRSDGAKVVGDGFYTANYFINETTILRVQAGGQVRPGPSPRNGTTLEG